MSALVDRVTVVHGPKLEDIKIGRGAVFTVTVHDAHTGTAIVKGITIAMILDLEVDGDYAVVTVDGIHMHGIDPKEELVLKYKP